jgi:hypothetical protein
MIKARMLESLMKSHRLIGGKCRFVLGYAAAAAHSDPTSSK